jgi:hypothetical protein
VSDAPTPTAPHRTERSSIARAKARLAALREQIRALVFAALLEHVFVLVWNAVKVAFAIVALDFLCTRLGPALPMAILDPISGDRRTAYVVVLLTVFGLPSVLLVTLTSLAMTTLSPYASPSVVLLHSYHPTTRLEIWWTRFAGKGNRFRWALQLALYVSASLFSLFLFNTFGWSAGFTLTLALITLIAVIDLILLLSYVYWIIGLRQPSRVIEYMLGIARNALTEVTKLPSAYTYRALPLNFARGRYRPRYHEQDRVLRLAQALTQSTLRALQDRQPIPAVEGVDALTRLFTDALRPRSDPRDEWFHLAFREVEDARLNWLRVNVLEGLRDVLVASAEAHYISVGQAALPGLDDIGFKLLLTGDPTDATDRELFRGLLATYVSAFDETLQFDEPTLRAELLPKIGTRIAQLLALEQSVGGKRIAGWVATLAIELPTIIKDTGGPSIVRDDLGALRAVTDLMNRAAAAFPSLRTDIATSALHLGATAIALRADRSASLLAGWIAGQFDRSGMATATAGESIIRRERAPTIQRFPATIAGATLAPTTGSTPESGPRPPFVTTDYVEVFLVLVAARASQFKLSESAGETSVETWSSAVQDIVRRAVVALPQGSKRCEWVCERVCNASHLGGEERKGWVAEVTKVLRR